LYFKGLQEEYDNDLDVLRAVVKVMGLKEFSKICGIGKRDRQIKLQVEDFYLN